MVVVAALGGVVIVPGDFVVAKSNDGSHTVCRVMNTILPHSFEVVWWRERVAAPPLCPNAHENLLRCKVKEVSADDSATSVIHCSCVVDVAFVFSSDDLEHVWTDVAGMSKVYFTRAMHHVPFSFTVSESYPSRVWFSLITVKDLVRKMMSCKRQRHVCKRVESIPFSLEGWRYISRFFHAVSFQKVHTKAYQYSDLSLQSKSLVKNMSMIRIMCCNTMMAARVIFGTTFGIGTRNIPPRKGCPRKVLEVGNIINLVKVPDVSEPQPEVSRKVREFIINQRIDFVFDEAFRTLSIRIKYCDEKAEAPIVSDILGFPRVDVTPDTLNAPRRARKVRAVPTETVFVYNDKFFTVTYSDGRRVRAICTDDNEEITLDNDFLWNLILDNIT